MEMTDRFKAMCNNVKKIDSLARNIESFEKPQNQNSLRRTLNRFPSEIGGYSKSSIRYFNVMFGNKNYQRNDYAEIQLWTILLIVSLKNRIEQIENSKKNVLQLSEFSIIFERWRTDLPFHYKPLIDFYQEKIDEIAPMIEKPTLAECVSSYVHKSKTTSFRIW